MSGVEPKWAGRAASPGSQSLCRLRAPAAPQLMRIGSVIGIIPAGRDYQLTRDGDYLCVLLATWFGPLWRFNLAHPQGR